MIHEQVQKQLDYLKTWVDGEEKCKKDCEEWKIPYIPSNRKWENERQYKEYLKEIEADSKEEAEEKLILEIGEGSLNPPEECFNSWCDIKEMEDD